MAGINANTHRGTRAALTLLVPVLLVSACVSVKPQRASGGIEVRDNPRVLLMAPDVLLLEITTAGVPIPRADWSARAHDTLVGATTTTVAGRGGELVHYVRPSDERLPVAPHHLPALRLYQVVLGAILTYRYKFGAQRGARAPALVTKSDDGLEWTLGDSVAPLRADYNADYALFLTFRAASSNSGRAMVSAAAFALFGVIETTSQSVGLATLVDLHSGEVVWTNLLSGSAFEVGEPEEMRENALKLLETLPL